MFYSHTTCGFYNLEINGDAIPDDALEISDALHQSLLKGQSEGLLIVSDGQGLPVLQERPAPAHVDLVDQTLATAKAMRLPIIGILDGMQSSALTDGDLPRAKAIETAKTGLKNITKVDLSGCTTADEMRTVVFWAYQAIAQAAPVDVQNAFAQVLA